VTTYNMCPRPRGYILGYDMTGAAIIGIKPRWWQRWQRFHVFPLTPHPAKFNSDVLDVIHQVLNAELPGRHSPLQVLDPFAGVGGIHTLHDPPWVETYGLEIEPEWAEQNSRTVTGDILTYDFGGAMFDVIATSPCYGNRMADHQDAAEVCSKCKGEGVGVSALTQQQWDGTYRDVVTPAPCPACDGKGIRVYDRITYKHKLGRDLSPNNSGAMQWGLAYRAFHATAYCSIDKVLAPGGLFILNMKNHIRGGVEQQVTQWHGYVLNDLGYTSERVTLVPTTGMGYGQNREARVDHESVLCLRKPL
jgi:hypothetical protein